jgi:transposase-like protein
MTELEVLDRDIGGLKELLRVAWKELASSALTPHERREARNRITLCSAELRRNLQTLEAERASLRKQSLEVQSGRSASKPQLRLLQDGY